MATISNNDIQFETRRLVKLLYELSTEAKKETREILEIASRPIVSAARAAAPVGDAVHYRYNTPKLTNLLRAPNGSGVKVATYRPGNLRDSIKAIFFRRAANSVFVGPVLARNPKGMFGPDYPFVYDGGTFQSLRTDGYYARWVEFGAPEAGIRPQPFMRPAAAVSAKPALDTATKLLKRRVESWAARYAKAKGR